MQMIDVLKRLKELESQGSEVTEAIKSVESMSAKVNEGVNITMSGSDAVLSQILKLAGMIGAETSEAVEGIEDDASRPYSSSPNEVTMDFDAAVPSGSDLHSEKETFPKVAGGDNPMRAPYIDFGGV
jgi:hypothetical protein